MKLALMTILLGIQTYLLFFYKNKTSKRPLMTLVVIIQLLILASCQNPTETEQLSGCLAKTSSGVELMGFGYDKDNQIRISIEGNSNGRLRIEGTGGIFIAQSDTFSINHLGKDLYYYHYSDIKYNVSMYMLDTLNFDDSKIDGFLNDTNLVIDYIDQQVTSIRKPPYEQKLCN